MKGTHGALISKIPTAKTYKSTENAEMKSNILWSKYLKESYAIVKSHVA